MAYRLLIVFLLLFNFAVSAQPGGGGGILIHTLIDKNGLPVNSEDPSLKIRHFRLSSDTGESIRPYDNVDKQGWYRRRSLRRGGLFIPPYIFARPFGTGDAYKLRMPYQLVQFFYQGDTTTFEFRELSLPNGGGFSDVIDTLQLLPGFYSYQCNVRTYERRLKEAGWRTNPVLFDSAWQLVHERGIHRTTIPFLVDLGLFIKESVDFIPAIFLLRDRQDTVYIPHKPVYRASAATVRSSRKNIEFWIDAHPLLESEDSLYRLLWPSRGFEKLWSRADPRPLELGQELGQKTVYINGQLYSGRMKWLIEGEFRYGNRPGQAYRYLFFVFHFRQGRLLRTDRGHTNNTDDLSEERYPESTN